MEKALLGKKVAVLVANGFQEIDMVCTQKMLQGTGANMRIVSMNSGLVNSWQGNAWGLNFAVDQALNQALAADFDILIVLGGQRSIEKLKLTAHTKRFVGGFMGMRKPVIAFDDAEGLLAFVEHVEGNLMTVSTLAPDADMSVIVNDLRVFLENDGVMVDDMPEMKEAA